MIVCAEGLCVHVCVCVYVCVCVCARGRFACACLFISFCQTCVMRKLSSECMFLCVRKWP
jgi:hypothetical protein